MLKCQKLGVDTPLIYHIDKEHHRIFMECIAGQTVRDFLLTTDYKTEAGIIIYIFIIVMPHYKV